MWCKIDLNKKIDIYFVPGCLLNKETLEEIYIKYKHNLLVNRSSSQTQDCIFPQREIVWFLKRNGPRGEIETMIDYKPEYFLDTLNHIKIMYEFDIGIAGQNIHTNDNSIDHDMDDGFAIKKKSSTILEQTG